MHHLQKHILDKLRFEQPLTYTDMLPDNMVSSQFQYHLKSLVAEEKTGLSIKKPSLCGVANMLISKNGKPLTHMITYAHKATLENLPNPLPKNCILIEQNHLKDHTDLVPGT